MERKGVTIPSQIRFSKYFISVSQSFKDGAWNNEREAYKELVSIQISNLPKIFSVWFMTTTVIDEKTKTYEIDRELMKKYKDTPKINFTLNYVVNRETKMTFYSDDSKTKPLFYFWFHSKFVTDKLVLDKRSLDKLNEKHLYDSEFSITLNFVDIPLVDLNAKLQGISTTAVKRPSRRDLLTTSLRRVKTNATNEFQSPVTVSSLPSLQTPESRSHQPKSVSSPLIDEYITTNSLITEVSLPALRDSEMSSSTTSSETTSYSTDYSDESPVALEEVASNNNSGYDVEQEEYLGNILREVSLKNNKQSDPPNN